MIITYLLLLFILCLFLYLFFRKNETFQQGKDESIVICGIVRDSSKNVINNLNSIKKIAKTFIRSKIIIVENDSVDGTDKLCQQWVRKNKDMDIELISGPLDNDIPLSTSPEDQIDSPFSRKRFEKMAFVRNIYMKELDKVQWDDCLVMIVDLDIKDIHPSNIIKIIHKEKPMEWNVLCANGVERKLC